MKWYDKDINLLWMPIMFMFFLENVEKNQLKLDTKNYIKMQWIVEFL